MARYNTSSPGLYFGDHRSNMRPSNTIGSAGGLATGPEVVAGIRAKSPDWLGISMASAEADHTRDMGYLEAETNATVSRIRAESAEERSRMAADHAKKVAGDQKEKAGMFGALSLGVTALKTLAPLAIPAISDRTTKNTITELEDSLSQLRKLRPVSFYYNEEYTDEPERKHYGFIAQEFREVMPDHTFTDSISGKLFIDTGELFALLVRSIQQLEARVAELES